MAFFLFYSFGQLCCGIDTSTFQLVRDTIVDGAYCWNQLRIYSIEDSCGNIVSCEQLIVVDDKVQPVFTDLATVNITDGILPLPLRYFSAYILEGGNATDNCSIVDSTFRFVGDVSDGASTPEHVIRTYEITDFCGNVGTSTQFFTVTVGHYFAMNCLPADTVECIDELPAPFVYYSEYINAGGVDTSTCGIDTSTFALIWTDTNEENCIIEITRTYFLLDSCSAYAICEQMFTVIDTTPPVLSTVPADTTVFSMDDLPPMPVITSTDNCSNVIPTPTVTISDLVYDNYLTIARKWIVEDDCGNKDSATQVIYVRGAHIEVYVTSCNSYTWSEGDRNTYFTSGVHDYFRYKAGDFNDTLKLFLTILSEYRDTVNVSICASDLPYIWRGYNIVSEGIYSDTLTSSVGCDSTITLILDVLPEYRDTTFISVCDSELPYNWRGITLSTEGTYSENFTSIIGCDSTTTLNLTVLDEITPSFALVGLLCQNSIVPILPAISNEGITGTWFPDTINTANVGVISYKFTPTNGQCAIPLVTVDVEITPEIILNETHVNIESKGSLNGSIDISIEGGTAPYSFLWSNGDFTEDISGLAAGNYSVMVTDIIGCEATLRTTIKAEEIVPDINCPPTIIVECFEEIASHLPHQTYSDYMAAGGWAQSNCGIKESTFNFVGEEVVTGNYCLSINRTYSIQDSCGNVLECEQLIAFDATKTPILNCPTNISVNGNENIPDRFSSLLEFKNAGGSFSDNCMIDTLTFELISEFMDTILTPDVLKRTYYIADKCGNNAICLQRIIIENATPSIVSNLSEELNFKLFPNPNNGMFTIDIIGVKSNKVSFEIFNSIGEIVIRKEIITLNKIITDNIDMRGVVSGIYHIKIMDNGKSVTKKIIIE